jgi:hypothetical protein
MIKNDTQILDWLENNPGHVTFGGTRLWRRVFGPKDETNKFATLREAVSAQIPDGKTANPAAVALGKLKSPAKAEASRQNGKQPCKPGRFRGRPRK